jgi:hypothetical protein
MALALQDVQLRFNLVFLKLDCTNHVCTYLPTFYFKWTDASVKKIGVSGVRSATRNEFAWKPTLQFSNTVECNLVSEHYSFNEDTSTAYCMVEYVLKTRCGVDLFRFPFDAHKLHFAFKTNANLSLWQNTEVEEVPSFAVMEDPFRVALKDENFIISNVQFLERIRAHKRGYRVMLWATRNPLYYLLNYMSLYFSLGLLALTTYAVPRVDFGGRVLISLLLLLIAVAFKAVIAAYVPPTPYLTFLDIYAIFVKIFIGIVILENYTATTCTSCSDDAEQTFFGVFFALWIASHTAILAAAYLGWLTPTWETVRQSQERQGSAYVSNDVGTFFLSEKGAYKLL